MYLNGSTKAILSHSDNSDDNKILTAFKVQQKIFSFISMYVLSVVDERRVCVRPDQPRTTKAGRLFMV